MLRKLQQHIDNGLYPGAEWKINYKDEIKKLDNLIKHKRDYDFAYAGLQQLIDKYLLKDRSNNKTYDHAHESPLVMLIPLFLLSIGSIFSGINGGSIPSASNLLL